METESATEPDHWPSKPRRLAIITRRFWPVSGASELAIGRLAQVMQRAGHTVEIFTVCWEKAWPKSLHFGEVPVRRLPKSGGGPWPSFRATRPLSRHIVDFQPDGILAFGADDETWTAAKAFADQVPLVVRIDSHWLDQPRAKSNAAARQTQVFEMASSILVDCRRTGDELERRIPGCGSKIQIVPDLVDSSDPDQRTLARQSAARNALSDAHPVLSIETDQPLVVCAAPLNQDSGVLDLVRAWPSVLHQFPKGRLWILGDGPSGKRVWEEINELELVYSVIMPGFFDELSEVLLAADLYVHPLRHTGYDSRLAEALLSGICCLAGPESQHDGLIQHGRTGLIADSQQTLAFADRMIEPLSQPELRQRLGKAGHVANRTRFEPQKIMTGFMKNFASGAEQRLSAVD